MAVVNPKLKKAYKSNEFTPFEIDEIRKCLADPYYFITTYYHVRTPDGDDLVFQPYEYQEKMLRAMIDHRRVICKMPRQSGKSTIVVAFLLFMVVFNVNQQVLLLSKDEASAKDLLRRFKFAFERLPIWLQVGVATNDVTRMEFDNGSSIQVSGTTLSAGRGLSPSCLVGSSKITLRDKESGEIIETTMEGLRERLTSQDTENETYQVLTDEGFKDFSGLHEIPSREVITLTFDDGTSLTCTEDHVIYTSVGKLEAYKLKIGDECISDSNNKVISSIHKCNSKYNVYDLLNVTDVNRFYANNILVSNCVFLDEFAFISGTVAPEFLQSVYPTISAGQRTKVIMVSTPRGMNHFYRLWDDAVKDKNGFVPIDVHWSEHPDRDERWAQEQKRVLGEDGFAQEYGCEFLGSSDTLISSSILRTLVSQEPILCVDGFHVFEMPQAGRRYVITADVSEGIGCDFSAASVFDVTEKPYRQVARYYDNRVSVVDYPNVLYSIGGRYNNAFILIEIGGGSLGVGDQVASVLRYDLEYENLFVTSESGRGFQKQAQELTFGAGPGKKIGLKTTKATKRRGCVNLKDLVEQYTLIVSDRDTIRELTNFVKVNDTFEATEGEHDDLVMTLVLFGWLVKQENFEAITDTTIQRTMMETAMLPFPVMIDGTEDEPEMFVQGGDVWTAANWSGGYF